MKCTYLVWSCKAPWLRPAQKHHVTCTTVNSCYNTPNPHAGATPSARLATTAYYYICIYIVTQSAPPTNYKEPAENGPLSIQVWMKPDSLYWPSLSIWAISYTCQQIRSWVIPTPHSHINFYSTIFFSVPKLLFSTRFFDHLQAW